MEGGSWCAVSDKWEDTAYTAERAGLYGVGHLQVQPAGLRAGLSTLLTMQLDLGFAAVNCFEAHALADT